MSFLQPSLSISVLRMPFACTLGLGGEGLGQKDARSFSVDKWFSRQSRSLFLGVRFLGINRQAKPGASSLQTQLVIQSWLVLPVPFPLALAAVPF